MNMYLQRLNVVGRRTRSPGEPALTLVNSEGCPWGWVGGRIVTDRETLCSGPEDPCKRGTRVGAGEMGQVQVEREVRCYGRFWWLFPNTWVRLHGLWTGCCDRL